MTFQTSYFNEPQAGDYCLTTLNDQLIHLKHYAGSTDDVHSYFTYNYIEHPNNFLLPTISSKYITTVFRVSSVDELQSKYPELSI